ncbi:MAG: excinuclease ABC subunit B [Candidatus Spechtbacteria bacterium RIFCSPHIGHO2_02_FULL_43_15b]|uniref:UvrABC system protein B n=1 Tax=Candidatus Spechtbacteria bacterium RIFCSPHIGHO2_01_FULL_43_30 TaxID=1802158 RepID=A0A1G2H6N2_9BACT|nr:MAG: excinuclease ABC subunit B [Candidatus Spechtbacteria bacterium RIFCSPHIGHO2_01_FULL_43_30]OGZ60190.1 MAG: excinuclease ABC subunit B [Candidatus Spechtbacteria bacterium RIFCSPHIGHO2_02_FULL_43_15b]
MSRFKLKSNFVPAGDQPDAVQKLSEGVLSGAKNQVLLGVTGSGKTFTMANVIEKINHPALVISHNKTLAWQLYKEFKEFFPENAVHYFVSYYDYYQPEAYIPQSDTYIEKDAKINEKIDQMRHAATQDLLTRRDVIIVASVSCIYNIGSPANYENLSLALSQGQNIARKELLNHLVLLGYSRNQIDLRPGQFRSRTSTVEIFPTTGTKIISIELNSSGIQDLRFSVPSLGSKSYPVNTVLIFPASFWATPDDTQKIAIANIRNELHQHIKQLNSQKKLLEAQRLEQRTNFDLELLEQTGFCHGIENYSRHLDARYPGEAPYTLLDYFGHAANSSKFGSPENRDHRAQYAADDLGFLTFIDESHMTIPQIRGMYFGDRSRKQALVDYGFRLPSALDNRPLTFDEFQQRIGQTIYVSATPAQYECEISKSHVGRRESHIIEQLVRPTGLLDPQIEIRPSKNQMGDLVKEIQKGVLKNQRVLVTTITKRLAEDIAEYFVERGIKAYYLHSEIHTLERPKILHDLRSGKYDVVVGINLLREGLDLPEVALVAILDADKEGFLRNDTTLIQTMGRAARHIEGRVIMYADNITESMKRAIKETERRRKIQEKYNKDRGITPKTIEKPLEELDIVTETNYKLVSRGKGQFTELDSASLKYLEKEMKKAAKNLDFEKAAEFRDKIKNFYGEK